MEARSSVDLFLQRGGICHARKALEHWVIGTTQPTNGPIAFLNGVRDIQFQPN